MKVVHPDLGIFRPTGQPYQFPKKHYFLYDLLGSSLGQDINLNVFYPMLLKVCLDIAHFKFNNRIHAFLETSIICIPINTPIRTL